MRKLLVIALIANAALLGVRWWQELPSVEAEGELAFVENGDVNGDRSIDVSDAVYLLNWLFQGGPGPVAIERGGSCRIPATGASVCLSTEGREIPCDSIVYPGQDGFHRSGCPLEGRFETVSVDEDDVVVDHCTGLTWQRQTAPELHSWQDALLYCESLDLGGYTDWRLPNVRELHSLIVWGGIDDLVWIDLEAFPDTAMLDDEYWTSNTSITSAPVVDFAVGDAAAIRYLQKVALRAVRAVRGP